MHYREVPASIMMSCGSIIIAAILFAERSSIDEHFYRFGPCSNDKCASIFGLIIDDWTKWSALVFVIILKETIISYAYTTYRPWFTNCVMDHKTANVGHSMPIVLLMVTNYKIFSYINTIIEITLVITMELQYIFVQFLIETAIYLNSSIHAMRHKVGYTDQINEL